MKADKTMDCLGFIDPMPIIKTAQKMKELKTSEVLEIIADDRAIKLDVPAWCQAMGHEYLGIEETNVKIKLYIRKTHD